MSTQTLSFPKVEKAVKAKKAEFSIERVAT